MNWFRNFMMGRYGSDQLSFGILILYLVLALIANLLGWHWLLLLAFLLLVWALFRMFSRQHEKRARENQAFLALLDRAKRFFRPVTQWFQRMTARSRNAEIRRAAKAQQKADRKTHVYVSCGGCGQQLRLPRGKGKLNARCPKCGHEFQIKT